MPLTQEQFQQHYPGITLPAGKEAAFLAAADLWATRQLAGREVPAERQDLLLAAKSLYVLHLMHVGQEFEKAAKAGLTVTVEGEGSVRRESSSFSQHSKQAEQYRLEAEKLLEEACRKPVNPFIPFVGVAR